MRTPGTNRDSGPNDRMSHFREWLATNLKSRLDFHGAARPQWSGESAHYAKAGAGVVFRLLGIDKPLAAC